MHKSLNFFSLHLSRIQPRSHPHVRKWYFTFCCGSKNRPKKSTCARLSAIKSAIWAFKVTRCVNTSLASRCLHINTLLVLLRVQIASASRLLRHKHVIMSVFWHIHWINGCFKVPLEVVFPFTAEDCLKESGRRSFASEAEVFEVCVKRERLRGVQRLRLKDLQAPIPVNVHEHADQRLWRRLRQCWLTLCRTCCYALFSYLASGVLNCFKCFSLKFFQDPHSCILVICSGSDLQGECTRPTREIWV